MPSDTFVILKLMLSIQQSCGHLHIGLTRFQLID